MPHLAATILIGAVLAVSPSAGTALADTSPRHERPAAGTALKLTVTHPEATTSSTRTVTLSCDPPGGSHPHAARACADLDRSAGRILRDLGETVCTAEYRPVAVHATGLWRGRPVTFNRSFPNPCVTSARTGAIFRF